MNRSFLRAVNARFLGGRTYASDLGTQFQAHPSFMNEGAGGSGGSGGAGGGDGGDGGDGDDTDDGSKDTPEQQIGALKQKNRDLIADKKKLNGALKAFKDAGIDNVDEAKEALAAFREWKKNGGKPTKEQEDQMKAIRDSLTAEHTKERGKLEKANKRLTTSLDRATRRNAISDAIREHGGRDVQLRDTLDKQIQLVPNEDLDEDAEDADEMDPFVVRVIDPKTKKIRYNRNGDPMTPSELVAEMKAKDEWAGAFDAPNTRGTGGKGSSNNAGNAPAGGGTMKISRADAENTRIYRAKKAEADKAGKELVIVD